MAKSSSDTDLLEEAVRNIREDRDLTYELINELRSDIISNRVSHKEIDRKSTRLNSSHIPLSRMPSSA